MGKEVYRIEENQASQETIGEQTGVCPLPALPDKDRPWELFLLSERQWKGLDIPDFLRRNKDMESL